jgi:hypothetical protein
MRRGNPLIYSAADNFCIWPRAALQAVQTVQKPAVVFSAVMGLPLRDCPMGRRAPPDFARYVPNHTRLIKTDDFQARSSTALEAAM